MRILHVVPFVADQLDGDGRLAVVLNECAELRRRGHDVHVLARWCPGAGAGRPRPPAPSAIAGVPVHLFWAGSRPEAGSSLRLTGRLRGWLARNAATFDLVHLHLTRDRHVLRSVSPIRRAGVPYVVQLHGALPPATGARTRTTDRLLTVPALRHAALLLARDRAERTAITDLLTENDRPLPGRDDVVELIGDGVVLPAPDEHPGHRDEGRPLDVVTIGRLGVDIQPMVFAHAAAELLERGVDATFSVLGQDGGALTALQHFIECHPTLQGRLRYEGTLDHPGVRERLARADVFVLAAQPGARSLVLLEALAAGIPTVVTTEDPHAITLRSRRAARVVRPSASAIAAALADLAAGSEERQDLGRRARSVAALLFDTATVVDRLEGHYATALLRSYPLPDGEAPPTEAPQAGRHTSADIIDLAVPRQPTAGRVRGSTPEPSRPPADSVVPALGTDRLLWVAVEATPHRLALWREVSRLTDLTVALLAPSPDTARLILSASAEPFHLVQLGARRGGDQHGVPRYEPPKALRTLVRRRPDAVVLDGWQSPAFHAAAGWAHRAGVPVVASYRTAERRTAQGESGGATASGDRPRPLRRLLRRADAVLVGGADAARDAIDMGVPAERITMAPSVPDLPPSESRAGLVDVRDGHRFLFIGPLIPRTNTSGLLHAFRLARAVGDVLTVAGDGPLAAELAETAAQLGLGENVVFMPEPTEAAQRARLLDDAHTVVIPSTDEVWGHDVEEALTAVRNVVVSTACAISDAIAARPEVFPAEPSPAALSRAMVSSRQHWTLRRLDRSAATISLDQIGSDQVVSAGGHRGPV